MAAYDAVPLAPLDISAGPVTTSEQLTTVIISLARGSLGHDEANILLGASLPPLRAPSPSALALSGLSALPAATTIDAKQIHHGGGEVQPIERSAAVRLQAAARGHMTFVNVYIFSTYIKCFKYTCKNRCNYSRRWSNWY
jgi:hypothetical protein